jgi:hypothetical protein
MRGVIGVTLARGLDISDETLQGVLAEAAAAKGTIPVSEWRISEETPETVSWVCDVVSA